MGEVTQSQGVGELAEFWPMGRLRCESIVFRATCPKWAGGSYFYNFGRKITAWDVDESQ